MIRVSKPYFYLLPAGAILFVFHLLAFLMIVWISLLGNWRTDPTFVGLANYRDILRSGEFVHSLGVTLWYAAGTIPATMGLALVFAVLLRRNMAGGTFYRVVYFLPYVTSTVAAALVWRWIFHVDDKGLANAVLGWFGWGPFRFTEESRGIFELAFGRAPPGIGPGPSLALVSVMIFSVWQTFGFFVIIFSAGLGQISKEVYEAAALDGAGRVRTFFSITVPLLRPILTFALVVLTIGAFQTFNQIYIMTPLEKDNTAQNVTMYIVTQFWGFGRSGRAAAAAVLLFVILVSLTLAQLGFHRKKD
jgi:ABC-type sugar transport system permease subunit